MLACGAFSPVGSFMGRSDYERVLHEMRLADGTLFPMPITLPIPDGTRLPSTGDVALRDAHNIVLAIMRVEDVYEWNYTDACLAITGTTDPRHPLVAEMASWGSRNIAGELVVLRHRSTTTLRSVVNAVRHTRALAAKGRGNVVAFHTRVRCIARTKNSQTCGGRRRRTLLYLRS